MKFLCDTFILSLIEKLLIETLNVFFMVVSAVNITFMR